MTEGGQLVVYKRSCPFIGMVDEYHTVCNIDLEMITQVVSRDSSSLVTTLGGT